MNAYELADEFKNRDWDEVDCVLWCEKSANMLHQQADRIAELEKILKEAVEQFNSASDGAGVNFYAYAEEWKTKLSNTTSQTKPLSDEEQDACFNRGYKEGFRDSLLKTKPLSGVEIIGMSGQFDFNYDVGIIDFARAIEAKVKGQ